MKALAQTGYGSVEVLQYVDIAKPVPRDNEVLVKICASAINDWELGILNLPKILRPFLGLQGPRGKFRIMGCDMAGIVQDSGRAVTRFKAGDAVYCDLSGYRFGGFAEYVCIKEAALARMPAGMNFEQAAALPHAAELALQGLGRFPALAPGQHVLVNGAGGGVGTLAIQLLKQHGVETTGVDRVQKLALLNELGYDHVLEYPRENFTRTGKQYDFILDTKTSASAFDYLRALKPGGIYATVGGSNLFLFMLTSLLCKPFTSKRLQIVALKPNQQLDRISELFAAGTLQPVIDRIYPFAEIPAAISRFRDAAHQGKIIIRVATQSEELS